MLTSTFLANVSIAGNDSLLETQWIKITSGSLLDISRITADNFEASISSCGERCQVVKLIATPFSLKGTLSLKINYCGYSKMVNLPFTVDDNDHMIKTPITTYYEEFKTYMCGNKYVSVDVSLYSNNSSYAINLNLGSK
jgi:hypothetical protein